MSRIGPVLVTGGNGFIAYHITAKILEEEPGCCIYCIDMRVDRNRHDTPSVHYHQGDLASSEDVERVMQIARPETIFHTASPEFSDAPVSAYRSIIVDGAHHVLNAARKVRTVRALINTSTCGVINDNHTNLIDATEDMPILRPPPPGGGQQKRLYCIAKADAEDVFQSANRNGGQDDCGILTCAIRPGFVFGERDVGSLGKMFAVARQGKSRFQMGDRQNAYDFIYAGNVADAHLLAAHALLKAWGKPPPADASARVDGECFHITNEEPWLFWDFQRAVSALAGNPIEPKDIVVIPKWVGLTLGFLNEWITWLLSGGTKPPNMTREGIRFSTLIRTLNGEKAKRVLGYRPQYTDQWKKWWQNPEDVQLYQFMGKDIVVYHSVIFPGTQLGTGHTWTKLHHLSTTEYLTYEGGKFSKSRGIGVFGDSAQKTGVPSDVWRYYLLSHRPETGDSEFDWDSFISANNNSLLKNLGNFVNRIIKFVNSRFNSTVPNWTEYSEASFDEWKADINKLLAQNIHELDAVKIRSALSTVLHISQQGNLFLQNNKLDNRLAENQPTKCAAVVGIGVNLVYLLACVIAPYMPDTAKSIKKQLCVDTLLLIPDHWDANFIKPDHKRGKAEYLFSRIRPEKAEEWRRIFGGDETQQPKGGKAAFKSTKNASTKASQATKETQRENKLTSLYLDSKIGLI